MPKGKDVSHSQDGAVSSQNEIDRFLQQVATAKPASTGGRRGRLVFAMDATASRQPSWDQAQHLQAEMFDATADLGGLDVQLIYYRGFRECRASHFVSDARTLRDRMLKVQCMGGLTQVGRVLGHVLKTTRKEPVQAVVFVGDAFEEDIDAVCDTAGQLGALGVPVFIFQEGHDPLATRAFSQIARLTGGAHCRFSMASAEELKRLLGAVAVYAAGGYKALTGYGERHGQAVRQLTNQMNRR
jgi:hypothetical protein